VAVARERLDQLVVAQGLAATRAKAQALILAGEVFAGERRLDKPGTLVAADTELRLKTTGPRYVSRGAFKLVAGLDAFAIDPRGPALPRYRGLDRRLHRGAARARCGACHAVDVGHGQLDWRLRNDPRVVVLERTNARHLTPTCCRPARAHRLRRQLHRPAHRPAGGARPGRPGAELVALIKPQFEAGPEAVGKGGVVRDPAVHEAVCATVRDWLEATMGWTVLGIVAEPDHRPQGQSRVPDRRQEAQRFRRRREPGEAGLEVLDQVVGVLEPDMDAHELAVVRPGLAVRIGRGLVGIRRLS
jgi:23S rRNA (cytidine1920-2'-O)/16S rRNA (cytidine1409-2'-O)-methyltransferase